MQQRRWMAAVGAFAVWGAVGCGSGQTDAFVGVEVPGGYELGGQTGSLVPDCGVAPLSSSGLPVPSGDVLAVLYGQGCPEDLAAEQVAFRGPGREPVAVSLEALEGGAYLVRASSSLPAGEYQLDVPGGEASTLEVGDEPSALPSGTFTLLTLPSQDLCTDTLRFELSLSPEALAYVSLTRWLVRVDGGDEQLWVDYGALELSSEDPSRAVLELPRCGSGACLEDGVHQATLRPEVAGEALSAEVTTVEFAVSCPPPDNDVGFIADSDDGCAISTPARSPANARWLTLTALLATFWAARRRR